MTPSCRRGSTAPYWPTTSRLLPEQVLGRWIPFQSRSHVKNWLLVQISAHSLFVGRRGRRSVHSMKTSSIIAEIWTTIFGRIGSGLDSGIQAYIFTMSGLQLSRTQIGRAHV